MDLEELKRVLEQQIAPDLLDQTLNTYMSNQAGDFDVSDFMAHLKSKSLLNFDPFKTDTIELTFFDGDSTRIDGTLSDDSRMQFEGEFFEEDTSPYILIDVLGEGAMGRVHLAKDRFLKRKVAFKELLPDMTDKDHQLRFLTEAQITSQLAHPHVVPIYGLADPESYAYSMKMVNGQTLKERISAAKKCTPVPRDFRLRQRLEIFLKVCYALTLAHEKGVIHRDLKPANIMLGSFNEVYVMDWGIARPFQSNAESVSISQFEALLELEKGQVIGTPRYMSPEQAGGLNDKLDQRSDIFSMGLILYELVNFKTAFKAKSTVELIQKVIRCQMEPHSEDAPPELVSMIAKATQRRRVDRYQNIGELAEDIERFLEGSVVHAHPYTPTQVLQRWFFKHRTKILIGVMTVVLGAMGITAGVMVKQQGQMEQAQNRQNKITHFLSIIANQAQTIDNRFLSFQGDVEGLYQSAQVLLDTPPKNETPIFEYTDFKAGIPPHFEWSPTYQQKLSFDSVVFKRAPGVAFTPDLHSLARQLSPMKNTLRQMFLNSHGSESLKLDRKKAQALLLNEKSPIIWSFIGFESGLHMSFPGKGNYPPEFDPRQRPWYKGTLNKKGFVWGRPYPDAMRNTLVIPCTRPLFKPDGSLLAISGIDVSLAFLEEQFIRKYRQDDNKPFVMTPQGKMITTMSLASDINQRLQKAFQNQDAGYLESKDSLFAYVKLPTLNWFYVVQVPTEVLLKK